MTYLEALMVLVASLKSRLEKRGDKARWSIRCRLLKIYYRMEFLVWMRSPIRACDPNAGKCPGGHLSNRVSTLRKGRGGRLIGRRSGKSDPYRRQGYLSRSEALTKLSERELREEILNLNLHREIEALNPYEYQAFTQYSGWGISEARALEKIKKENVDREAAEAREMYDDDHEYLEHLERLRFEDTFDSSDEPELEDYELADEYDWEFEEASLALMAAKSDLEEIRESIDRSRERLARIRELAS